MRNPVGLAVADGDVGLPGDDRRDEARDIGAAVLVVRVRVDDHVGAQAQRSVDAGHERRREPAVLGESHDVVDAELLRALERAVGAAVVDDEHLDLVEPGNLTR
jgi:hypothetical protein